MNWVVTTYATIVDLLRNIFIKRIENVDNAKTLDNKIGQSIAANVLHGCQNRIYTSGRQANGRM